MRLRVSAGSFALLLAAGFAGVARAQTDTLAYDHVHLAAPDPVKAVEWYRKDISTNSVARPRS